MVIMNKMYSCINKCLCSRCKNVKGNCATCKESVKKTKECVTGGIKKCAYFVPIEENQKGKSGKYE